MLTETLMVIGGAPKIPDFQETPPAEKSELRFNAAGVSGRSDSRVAHGSDVLVSGRGVRCASRSPFFVRYLVSMYGPPGAPQFHTGIGDCDGSATPGCELMTAKREPHSR